MAKISVIGTGYVGLVTGACFAEMGHYVTCLDINEERISKLNQSIVPFYEPELADYLSRNSQAGRLKFTTNYPIALKDGEFVLICVGTPPNPDGSTDMSQWNSCVENILKVIDHPVIIVNKSTLPVGSGRHLKELLSTQAHHPNAVFTVVSNPEFLREGSAVKDSMQPDRIVVGSDDQEALEKVASLYVSLNRPVVKSDLNTAELTKYASNSYLAARISFINEISNICELVGADVNKVAEGMGYDHRIGSKYLNPGIGWGGSCFPKDIKSLIHFANQYGLDPQILRAVEKVNYDQRKLVIKKLKAVLGDLEDKTIAILGLAFKPNTDDLREAPALDIIQQLLDQGAHVRAYDPVAMELARPKLPAVTYVSSHYEAAKGADALVIVTEWPEFFYLDLAALHQAMRNHIIIDGRNIYDPATIRAAGFTYKSMGRR